jgi:hypothetical protein
MVIIILCHPVRATVAGLDDAAETGLPFALVLPVAALPLAVYLWSARARGRPCG